MGDRLELSRFQERALAIPEDIDIFMGGGRGGAKSFTMALLGLRHIAQHRHHARVLYVRRSYPGLVDFEGITRDLFFDAFGGEASYNGQAHLWRFAHGGLFELGQLESEKDYSKYQGRSFTLLLIDEMGEHPQLQLLDRLRSNLRGPKEVPLRVVMAANPGGVSHSVLSERYALRGDPWMPFVEPTSDRMTVYAPSTYKDNPFIDQDSYRAQLAASCPGDPELLRAWLEGDWAVARGAFFAGCLSEERNALPNYKPGSLSFVGGKPWRFRLGHDWGSSAPSVTILSATAPPGGGWCGPKDIGNHEHTWYPGGSILLLDELATNVPGDLTTGLRWTVPRLADAIKDMCHEWSVKPYGVCDDACFAEQAGAGGGSIASGFADCSVFFEAAGKGRRVPGWQRMRTMLCDAGSVEKPGLYISRRCSYTWSTVPVLPRDPRDPEDLDSRAPDHAADCARYIVVAEGSGPSVFVID